MSSTNNLITLASTSFESKNFDQAYKYYSQLLEQDTEKSSYWLYKGLAAGWLGTPLHPKIEEMLVSIRKAQSIDSNAVDSSVPIDVIEICDQLVASTIATIDKEVNEEFDRKPMATGELYSVHQLAKIPIQLSTGNRYSTVFLQCLNALEFAISIDSQVSCLKKSISIIDKFLQHSADNADYFKTHKDAGNRFAIVDGFRVKIVGLIQQQEPHYAAPQTPEKKSGCYIVTATLPTPSHPFLSTFYSFRDEVLLLSRGGKFFVKLYYSFSPPIAAVISHSQILKTFSYYSIVAPLHFVINWILHRTRENKRLN
jgi:tetratricopeptide (TPR) repeat protein